MGRHFVLGHCLANSGKLTPNIGICFVSVFAAFNVPQAGNSRVADIRRYIGTTRGRRFHIEARQEMSVCRQSPLRETVRFSSNPFIS